MRVMLALGLQVRIAEIVAPEGQVNQAAKARIFKPLLRL
jgi:hypothetical protein